MLSGDVRLLTPLPGLATTAVCHLAGLRSAAHALPATRTTYRCALRFFNDTSNALQPASIRRVVPSRLPSGALTRTDHTRCLTVLDALPAVTVRYDHPNHGPVLRTDGTTHYGLRGAPADVAVRRAPAPVPFDATMGGWFPALSVPLPIAPAVLWFSAQRNGLLAVLAPWLLRCGYWLPVPV